MKNKLKIHLAQINTSVGDIEGNYEKILTSIEIAKKAGCNLVVFPEMTITGYPAEDLWLNNLFIQKSQEKITDLIAISKSFDIAIIVGAPYLKQEGGKKAILHNSAFFIENGKILEIFNKNTLPNYGVFDEKRYFEPTKSLPVINFFDLRISVLICEDLWDAKNTYLLLEKNLDLIISINASPYTQNKHLERLEVVVKTAKTLQIPIIYLNQVGGQDALIFDGSSFISNKDGEILLQLAEFTEDAENVEISESKDQLMIVVNSNSKILSNQASRNYSACVLGLRDYSNKNSFQKVVLGMSGGIDSALVATIAVDALGAENVNLYALPTRFNSNQSFIDATRCAENLRITLKNIGIESIFKSILTALEPEFKDLEPDVTEENLQARIRGNILMALSNKFGALLLTTGNKSELATGYSTLYGDMCGGFNPIKDLYKTEIFALAKWRNENVPLISKFQCKNIIPASIINKPPTAELRLNQQDSDSLPEYEVLDKILFALVEEGKSIAEVVDSGSDERIVKKVAKLLKTSQHKRSQSAIGPKISKMSFDKDYRYPISNKFST